MSSKFISATGKTFAIDKDGYIKSNGKMYLASELAEAGKGTIVAEESDGQAEPAEPPQVKKSEKPPVAKPEENRTVKQFASELAETIADAPGIVKEGLKRNPAGVVKTAALNTVIPNAHTAYREGRYAGIPLGLGLDALQIAASPLKMLKLGGKMLGMSNRLVNPVTKSHKLGQSVFRNLAHEAIIGAGDNLAFEAAQDALDDRSHGIGDYAFALGLGLGAGGLTSPLHLRAQKINSNEYAKWLPESPKTHAGKVKQNIRNAQNDTGSDFETFSKMVNEGHPLTTTKGHQNKATEQRKKVEEQMSNYEKTQEANAPAENATLSDFQDKLDEKLYKDHSGNLAQTEKDLVFKNFYDDAVDMLISNSPRLQNYLEENSKKVLGSPRAYLGNKDFMYLALERYSLSPNEMNMMRRVFQNKTTLTIPSKSGYVRAGADNRNSNEYSQLFKDHIDTAPETGMTSELNKRWSAARNHEELIEKVLSKQGTGGILNYHFPYFKLNPETNPTIIGNHPMQARNIANQLGQGFMAYKEVAEEDREELNRAVQEIAEDAKKLGITTQEGIKEYVLSKLEGRQPKVEIIGYSEQKRGEK